MTPSEFVLWFKGFAQAANTYNITPKQWDTICEYLEKVKSHNEENVVLSRYNPSNSNSTWSSSNSKTILND
jgi:hypothetical protein